MKILSIVGVRPQFVKAATICSAVERFNQRSTETKIAHLLLNTGQHYDHGMADIFFQQLPLPVPDYNLEIGSGSHGAQTGAMLEKIEDVLFKDKPDYVVVYGDTNSTLAGTLAASKLHIPVAHIEAGLRSFNRRMPEEINRIVADHLADVLLCPTEGACLQLQREGMFNNVYFTGDVMLDAVQEFAGIAAERSTALRDIGVSSKEFILVTIHRAENTDSLDRTGELVETLCELKRPTVFSMHPRLRAKFDSTPEYKALGDRLKRAEHVKITLPLSYLDMLCLEANAQLIMTDSGGVQKEAYFVATPCLTLRDETEWIETLQGGWNHVTGTSPKAILPLVKSLWSQNGARPSCAPSLSAFGDGKAADNILQVLTKTHPEHGNSQ
ncbi:MAG TPA: UDP-N-acetylglucosamine 2-epimerase (non-hydrolyzing) [Candidatus Angelobacter sp.]|nr:UDP-N-acetylglucosamine 2-epimerase (non-hydrolyzing) [Candidatus Angelobacter sp.]